MGLGSKCHDEHRVKYRGGIREYAKASSDIDG